MDLLNFDHFFYYINTNQCYLAYFLISVNYICIFWVSFMVFFLILFISNLTFILVFIKIIAYYTKLINQLN
jgi:hypothetical protein